MLSEANRMASVHATLASIATIGLDRFKELGAEALVQETIDGYLDACNSRGIVGSGLDIIKKEMKNMKENKEECVRLVQSIIDGTIEIPCQCPRCRAYTAQQN